MMIQRFRYFCQKKLPDFNTSATCHLAAEMPKKSFALSISTPFYAQSYAFIGSKHNFQSAKGLRFITFRITTETNNHTPRHDNEPDAAANATTGGT
ncbi:hypothetical protein JHU38_11620 [Prevotella sp. A2931]|uniref:Uncharacterized protein n=1 Tax=Prevotella illustrans TaxID=2800387 RepID=A0ABS3M880_9BACT|nr:MULTISPECIES: hypothetical protein [Prevotella]MBO1364403.1 hypothetical protein [Prevotella illustrans]PTL26264.1 hypothetical protein C3V39_03855 [Prevotella sp. oral taxon 820]